MDIISTHNIMDNDVKLESRYLATQAQTISHFEYSLRLFEIESQQECQRWNALPHSLQIREYHSLERLRNTLEITPLYKRAMQILKINYIGLKLNPPLLLGLQEGRNEEEEGKQSTDIEKDACFYPYEGTPSTEP